MPYILNKTYAGVCVKRNKNDYQLTDETGTPLTCVKQGTPLQPLDEKSRILAETEILKPSGTFFITAETIDPYHIILDILDKDVLTFTIR